MKLQLLVPQYKETEEMIKPLLDSVAIQRGIDFSDIGMIIVNDGTDVILDKDFLEKYPFHIDYYRIEHKGVSGARNFALRMATADYVMFCDSDDKFYGDIGLWYILRTINEEGFDMLQAEFYEEIKMADGKYTYQPRKNDPVFVHGKVYRRLHLMEKRIFFDERLHVHEDANFNGLALQLAKDVKVATIIYYIWCWRDDSTVRIDPLFALREYYKSIGNRILLMEECMERSLPDKAAYFCGQMVYDMFKTSLDPRWQQNEDELADVRKDLIAREREFIFRFQKYLAIVPTDITEFWLQGIREQLFVPETTQDQIRDLFNKWFDKLVKGDEKDVE